jgi:hypothetical protein
VELNVIWILLMQRVMHLFCALRHPMTTSRRITFGKLRCIVCV